MASVINGVHLLLASSNPEADRAFFRDTLAFAHVDVGEGWLIFALPPAELGIHPAEKNLTNPHAGQDLAAGTLYLMCDDLLGTLESLAAKGVEHTEVQEQGWVSPAASLYPAAPASDSISRIIHWRSKGNLNFWLLALASGNG